MHSYHRPVEEYGRDVALGLSGLRSDGIIVRESPRKRIFSKLLREYDAAWVLDIHSDSVETMKRDVTNFLERPYPLLLVRYGYLPEEFEELDRAYKDAYQYGSPGEAEKVWFSFSQKGRVRKLLDRFAISKYGTVDVYVPSDWYPQRRHPNLLTLGLAFFRPIYQSLEFVKSLAEYLQYRSL